jgi:hypothetical protein
LSISAVFTAFVTYSQCKCVRAHATSRRQHWARHLATGFLGIIPLVYAGVLLRVAARMNRGLSDDADSIGKEHKVNTLWLGALRMCSQSAISAWTTVAMQFCASARFHV